MDPLLNLHRHIVVSSAHHIIMLGIVLMSVPILLSCSSTAPAACMAAHQSVTDWVYGLCNTAQFSSNDTFAANFNSVKESLTRNSSQTLYSSASSLSGSESTFVFGIYQCRGDVSLSDCSVCVFNALSSVLTVCGYLAKGARAQYKGCHTRYENYQFASGLDQDTSPTFKSCSSSNDSSPVYRHNLGTALNTSASAAPKHALFGYNASSASTGSSTRAYALSQCLGYLSPSECATCLSVVSNYSGQCNNSVSGGVYFVGCYYIYDNTSFLFTYTNSSLHPPSISPSSPQRSLISSAAQERKKNSTPIIIGIVMGVSLIAIATIVALSLCYLKRRSKADYLPKAGQGPLHASASDQLPRLYEVPQQLAAGATRFSVKKQHMISTREINCDFGPVYQLGGLSD